MKLKDQTETLKTANFKRKTHSSEDKKQPITSQVLFSSQFSVSSLQKSSSQVYSKGGLVSGNPTLLERINDEPSDIQMLKRQNAELRIMQLSEVARQNLMKMQRFDRVLYPLQSDRVLKKPIQQELKRLQKIKNQQKQMRSKYYDNELTITALYNHIKLIYEMNRELEQRENLKRDKDEAVRKLHQQKRQNVNEVRELKEQLRIIGKQNSAGKAGKTQKHQSQSISLKKLQITAFNFIGANVRNKKYRQTIEEIQKFVNSSKESQPQACKLLEMFIPVLNDQISTFAQCQTSESKISDIKNLIEKITKQIKANKFQQMEKIKSETMKVGSQYKNVGLMIESIFNMKKLCETQQNRKLDESKSLEKMNQRVKILEDQLKITQQQLNTERANSVQLVNNKQILEKQMEKIKTETVTQQQIKRLRTENEVSKKAESENKKITIKLTQNQDELKNLKEQLNSMKISNNENLKVNKNLQIIIQKQKSQLQQMKNLQQELQIYKKNENQKNKTTGKLKSIEDELKSIRSELSNQKNSKANLQRQFNNVTAENQSLRKVQIEHKKAVTIMKQNEEQLSNLKEQITSLQRQKNEAIKATKLLEKSNMKIKQNEDELTKVKDELANLREINSQNQRVRLELSRKNEKYMRIEQDLNQMKKNERNTKNKQDIVMQNLKDDLSYAQSDLTGLINYIDKLIKVTSSNKIIQDLDKLRKQLTSSTNPSSRKLTLIIDVLSKVYGNVKDMQVQIQKIGKQWNEKKKKVDIECKSIGDQLTELRNSSNFICQTMKSVSRIWSRTKPEELLLNNNAIDLLSTEFKKGSHNHNLEQIQLEVIGLTESLLSYMQNQTAKLEDGYLKKIQQKQRQIEKMVFKEQSLNNENLEKEKKIKEIEDLNKNTHCTIDELKKENQMYVKELQKLNKQIQKIVDHRNMLEQEKINQGQNNQKISKELVQSKQNLNKFTNQKELMEIQISEAHQQIIRLKKLTQDYVEKQKKMIETLEISGVDKQKMERDIENIKKMLEKVEKQKQNLDRKTKNQNVDITKFKQMEINFQNSIQQKQIQNQTFQKLIATRDKQIKNLQEKLKTITEHQQKKDKDISTLEKQLTKQKSQIEQTKKLLYNYQQQIEKQKRQLTREIQKLNKQIKFDAEEREIDRKHYTTIISRVQKNLSDCQLQKNQQIKEIQTRMSLILQQKQSTLRESQLQQNNYRQKLKQVSKVLELTSNSGEKQKIQMKKQIERLTLQLNSMIAANEAEKAELKKTISKQNQQKQKLVQQKHEEKNVYQIEIQKIKNQQYEINYLKLKKQKEEIKNLQEQVDKLNEIIDINEKNYNKIVDENKQMYQQIIQFENKEKNYHYEIQNLQVKSAEDINNYNISTKRNVELTKSVDKLESQVKQLQMTISSNSRQIAFINEQKNRIRELDKNLETIQQENIKYKVHEDENGKLINKLREENSQLKAENAAIDKQLYATKSRSDFGQSQGMLLSKYEDMSKKYEQANEQSIKFRVQNANYERIVKEKDLQITRVNKDIEEWKKLAEQRYSQIQNTNTEKSRSQIKIVDIEKQYLLKQLNLQKQVEIHQEKIKEMAKYIEQNVRLKTEINNFHHEINGLKDEKIRLEKQIIQLKNQVNQGEKNCQFLQKEIEEKKRIIQLRQQQIKDYFTNVNKSLMQPPQQNQNNNHDMSGTLIFLERTLEERRREIQKLQTLLETTNKRYDQKNHQLSSSNLQLKHLAKEKQMMDVGWKQKLQSANDRNKQLVKQIQTLRSNFDGRKEQFSIQFANMKIEKDRLQKIVQEAQLKINEFKGQLDKALRELSIKDEHHKITLEKLSSLSKKQEDFIKNYQKLQVQYSYVTQQNKKLNQQILIKDDSTSKEMQKITENFNEKIEGLRRQIEIKQKTIEQKQLQIRDFIGKMANKNNQNSSMIAEKQIQLKTNTMLLERTIDDLKRENDRLQIQVDGLNKKIQEKLTEVSTLLLTVKHHQMEKHLLEEQLKHKTQIFSNTINDLERGGDNLKAEIKNSQILHENEKNRWKEEKQKYDKKLNDLTNRNRLMDESIQKFRIQKVTIAERERELKSQLQVHEQQLRKAYEKQNKLEGGTRRMKQENKYLKEIVQMLDNNYVEDEQQDENEIKILLKISEEISCLIQKNFQLEKQLKSNVHKSYIDEEERMSSIEFLIQSLLDYLNERKLIGHKNVTRFIYNAQFKAESLYGHKQKYLTYAENFIKELFQSVVAQLNENVKVYQKTINDVKKFLDSYFKTGDHKYLESLKRGLKNFDL